MSKNQSILALNAGSSSLKVALFEERAGSLVHTLTGLVERLGTSALSAAVKNGGESHPVAAPESSTPGGLVAWISANFPLGDVNAVGHRLVHGGRQFMTPLRVTEVVLAELRQLIPLDPGHLPLELDLLDAFARQASDRPQFACFDTTFHRHMPRHARLLPLPRRLREQGVERFGFHGLAFGSVLQELERRSGDIPHRAILAHLGSGSSLAAVLDGRSVDTTMAFTPTSGVTTSTRAGDVDAGLVPYLLRSLQLDADGFERLVTRESGLLGISETSADMRDLLARRAEDQRAADAVAVYCYQVKKAIGALTAALGGVDLLAFSGGIGEHAAPVRAEICEGLGVFGIELEEDANSHDRAVISRSGSRVQVHVVEADEEWSIASTTRALLKEPS